MSDQIIAQWRKDSTFERWLGRRADSSDFWKWVYVSYYRIQDRAYYDKGCSMASECLCKFGRDSLPDDEKRRLVLDMIYSLHRFGFMYEEYFWYDLQHLKTAGRKEFIPDKVRYALYDEMNDEDSFELFNDKWRTYEALSEFFGREALLVDDASKLGNVEGFLRAHGRCVVKPLGGNCGRGVSICGPDMDATVFESLLVGGRGFIVEEAIEQDQAMAAFHPSSVNTVRIPTLVSSGEVHIFGPFFRMGRGASFIDNAGAGGVFANVEPSTGICFTAGVDEVGQEYLRHPDTGKVIPGFQIPKWEEALALARKLARLVEGARYVGWDLALTPSGWVVVEGNSRGQFVMQIADKRGRMRELLELVYEGKAPSSYLR